MIEYEIVGNMAVITGCSKDESILNIPTEIEGKPVAKIKEHTCREMTNIKAVYIPGTVKVIGAYAFASCKHLTKLVIEEGLEAIEDWAFISCPIKELELPKSLKLIGTNAFMGTTEKEYVDSLIKSNDVNRAMTNKLNNKSLLLPKQYENHLDLLGFTSINRMAKYNNEQFLKYTTGDIALEDMDIPFVFDNDEAIIAFYSRVDVENLSIRLSDESKAVISEYENDNRDFLVLSCDICDNENIISSFIIKTPFNEGIDFKILRINSKRSKEYKYYAISVSISLKAYGSGNVDRLFSLNQFDELERSINTAILHKELKPEYLDELKLELDNTKYRVLADFLHEIKCAPMLSYVLKLYNGVLHDEDLKSDRLISYVKDRVAYIYENLNTFDSMLEVAFNLDNDLGELLDITNASLDDLNSMFDLKILDPMGNEISQKKSREYKKDFISVDDNFILHAKYLLRVYKEMSRLYNLFSLKKYLIEE